MIMPQLKPIISVALVFLFVLPGKISGQPIAVNPGVDTTDQDIRSVIALWTSYLSSNPTKDNSKDSPFWADTEKSKFTNVDQLLYAISTDIRTYSMGNPTILYVKPNHDLFEIKTLFSWTDSAGMIYASCITSVFAKKEKDQYKLYNALTVNAAKWKTQKTGNITFHFPPSHTFDANKANSLLQSVNDLIKQWNLKAIPVDYYFADTYEEVEILRGLDYCAGMGNKDRPSGMSDVGSNTVFAGGLGENYFHEVVHLYMNRLFPKSPLVEGLAVFYGGSLGHDLKWHLSRLNGYLDQHPGINLYEPYKYWYMDNYTNPNSTIQGLLCLIAYKNGGLDKLKKLMLYEDMYAAMEKEFGVSKEQLNDYLREQIKAFKN